VTETIAVVEKAFRVLEAMSAAGAPMTLMDITKQTALPKPTVFRILRTLIELGFVDQDQLRRRYDLTLKLYNLGRGNGYDDIRQDALPIMQALHARFDETVNLGVLQGGQVLYIHYIETTKSVRWQVRPGVRDPYYCTALGRAIAAYLPERRRRRLLETVPILPRTAATPTDAAAVERILEETAARGWASDDQENDNEVVCLGIPLFEAGQVVAGISITVVRSRMTPALRAEIIAALSVYGPGPRNPDGAGG
jgi:DNA-binding IclR family transcriptional regulator